MNFPFSLLRSRPRQLLLGSLLIATLASGRAQGQNSKAPDPSAAAPEVGNAAEAANLANKRLADLRKDASDAKDLAKSNNIAAAELVLTKTNAFQKDTPEWHFETTQKLLQTANDLSKEGKGTAVRALATQSLQRLNDAATATKDNAVKAKAKADAAFIHDRYMGDPTTAIATYKAALQLAPTDKNVKEALERLEKADANLRAKIRPTRK